MDFVCRSGVCCFSRLFYRLTWKGRLDPVKLTLAGAAMSALFSSLTQGMLSVNEAALEQALFWLAGSVQGRDLSLLLSVLPYIVLKHSSSAFCWAPKSMC
ncbi:iron chelate uptake ABC transporter family permease subunit [Bacillus sonorensis]|nr:iron chelate uptake ABC transporter family permease subunit [Bacillus sonorensis]